MQKVKSALKRYQIPASRNEWELQESIAQVLLAEGIVFEREVMLSRSDRIDFLCRGGIGIEVKASGGPSGVIEQVFRYAQQIEVTGLLLVSLRRAHDPGVTEINGKPFVFVWVCESL